MGDEKALAQTLRFHTVSTFYWLSWQLTKPLTTGFTARLQNRTREDRSVHQRLLLFFWRSQEIPVGKSLISSEGSCESRPLTHSLRSPRRVFGCKTITSGCSALHLPTAGAQAEGTEGTHTSGEGPAAKQAPYKHVPRVTALP